MAESKRRGEDAVDERLDGALDDAVDDDALDDVSAEEALVDDGDPDIDAPGTATRQGPQATKPKPKTGGDKGGNRTNKVKSDDNPGIFGRLLRFIREVVAELRKVIWPTRKELLTYATVVIVFVTIMLTIVGLLDLGFAKAVLFVFGGTKK